MTTPPTYGLAFVVSVAPATESGTFTATTLGGMAFPGAHAPEYRPPFPDPAPPTRGLGYLDAAGAFHLYHVFGTFPHP